MSEDPEAHIHSFSSEVAASAETRVLNNFEEMLKGGKKILFATDFDNTISQDGPSKGEDPRDSVIDPRIKKALIQLQEADIDLAIISARSARKIAQIAQIPGLQVIGTMGWETFKSSKDNPSRGVSVIHESFSPFEKPLTEILEEVRHRFVRDDLKQEIPPHDSESDAIEMEYLSKTGGKVVLERKGVNEAYPEGIYHTYNFNQVDKTERAEFAAHLEQYYIEAFDKALEKHTPSENGDLYRLRLMQKWGIMPNSKSPLDNGRYSSEIGPRAQRAKTGAIIQFMRRPNSTRRHLYFESMEGGYESIIYSGDHIDQDGLVFDVMDRVGKAKYVKGGTLQSIHLWINSDESATRPNSERIHGVSGNARIVEQMATLATAYKTSGESQKT